MQPIATLPPEMVELWEWCCAKAEKLLPVGPTRDAFSPGLPPATAHAARRVRNTLRATIREEHTKKKRERYAAFRGRHREGGYKSNRDNFKYVKGQSAPPATHLHPFPLRTLQPPPTFAALNLVILGPRSSCQYQTLRPQNSPRLPDSSLATPYHVHFKTLQKRMRWAQRSTTCHTTSKC